jgi:hypothetical protein
MEKFLIAGKCGFRVFALQLQRFEKLKVDVQELMLGV